MARILLTHETNEIILEKLPIFAGDFGFVKKNEAENEIELGNALEKASQEEFFYRMKKSER